MTSLLHFKRTHVWFDRYPWAWFELWLNYDYHNIIFSCTILTYQVGIEYVWKKAKYELKKNSHQFIIDRI